MGWHYTSTHYKWLFVLLTSSLNVLLEDGTSHFTGCHHITDTNMTKKRCPVCEIILKYVGESNCMCYIFYYILQRTSWNAWTPEFQTYLKFRQNISHTIVQNFTEDHLGGFGSGFSSIIIRAGWCIQSHWTLLNPTEPLLWVCAVLQSHQQKVRNPALNVKPSIYKTRPFSLAQQHRHTETKTDKNMKDDTDLPRWREPAKLKSRL